jgi:hypothetical protein
VDNLGVAHFDTEPVQSRDVALAILHGAPNLITVPAEGKVEGRPQLRPNVLACETCCPRGRNRAGAPKNRSNEPFLRAKEIAAR